jgi:hypothetical protein
MTLSSKTELPVCHCGAPTYRDEKGVLRCHATRMPVPEGRC